MAKKREKTTARVTDYAVLQHPVITEKSAAQGGGQPTVVFRVDPRATKLEVRGAVERIFNVKVESVRTCTFIGKVKRSASGASRRAGYKKAYVTLAAGSSIDIVEGL
jgi:large subunit ribosomal protein L23